MINEEDFDHIIQEPFLTEEGFVNEACMNELSSVIDNIPPAHERLKNDPEWSAPRWTNCRHITGFFAYWAVKQLSAYDGDTPAFAPNLEKLVSYLHYCIRPKFDKTGLAKLSLCDISKLLYGILMETKLFLEWNTKESLGDYWLDLDAFIQNICISIRQDRRECDEFDKKFDAEYGHLDANDS